MANANLTNANKYCSRPLQAPLAHDVDAADTTFDSLVRRLNRQSVGGELGIVTAVTRSIWKAFGIWAD